MFFLVFLTSMSLFAANVPSYSTVKTGKATAVAATSNRTTCALDAEQFRFTTSGSRSDMALVKFDLPMSLRGKSFNELTSLRFSWCRTSDLNWHNSILPDGTYIQDWRYKSPFLRVYLANGLQLVWEAYYNHQRTPVNHLVDQWISENALEGRWWAHQEGLYTTKRSPLTLGRGCALRPAEVWSGKVKALPLDKIKKCFGQLEVTGFSIGVGNQWPLSYQGYALPMRYEFR